MDLVDWKVAAATGTRLVPPGPRVDDDVASEVVADLHRRAAEADRHVARVTGLDVAPASATTVVVDRPDWIRNNVDSFAELVDPLLDDVVAKARTRPPNGLVSAVGSRITGAQVGALLAYLATRVLGQYELLGGTGRLSLVAPNIVSAERSLGVDPGDFRLWVCLHEVTHRTQFAAAPWLTDHIRGQLRTFVEATDLDAAALFDRLRRVVSGLSEAVRSGQAPSLVELVQTPEQREVLDRITGLMSLLEGHADVVMDAVGPEVVPSVAIIRERFSRRREAAGRLDRAIRRLIGMDAKLRQYAEGADFVRAVLDAVGMAGLNRVWTSPDLLPSAAEIRDPARWLARTA
jgi:coenzyme F420 biosynthesis associated uncharacterized protein